MNNAQEDVWAAEKIQLEKFWSEIFNYTINWEDYILPPKTEAFPHLNIRPASFSVQELFDGINNAKNNEGKSRLKPRVIPCMMGIQGSAEKLMSIVTFQEHLNVNGNYAWADRGTQEPDECHQGKSYDDAMAAGIQFLGQVEYWLSSAQYEFVTGNLYDAIGNTYLSNSVIEHFMFTYKAVLFGVSFNGLQCSTGTTFTDECFDIHGIREAVFGKS